jgi:alpha-1,2-mannosyltransferase
LIKKLPFSSTHLLFAVAFAMLYLPVSVKYGYRFTHHEFIDLPSFHYAAKAAFSDGFSPYDYDRLTKTYTGQHIFPFLYAPPAVLLFYPLSLLDYSGSAALMLAISHLAFLLSLFLMFRIFRLSTSHLVAFFFCIYVFNFQPFYLTLSLGQVNLILLFLICLFWYFYSRDSKDWMTAIPLSLAIALKTYPVLFLIYFLIKRQYRLLSWTSLYLVVLVVTSWLVLPAGSWQDWLVNVVPTGGVGETPYQLFNPAAPWNQGINGFVSRLFLLNDFNAPLIASTVLTKIFGYGAILAVLLIMVRILWKARGNASEIDRNYQIGLILLVTYLIAPLSWEHHLVFLLPCILLFYQDLLAQKFNIFYVILVVITLVLAKDFPLEAKSLKSGAGVLLISLKFYAVVMLAGYFAWRLVKKKEALIIS